LSDRLSLKVNRNSSQQFQRANYILSRFPSEKRNDIIEIPASFHFISVGVVDEKRTQGDLPSSAQTMFHVFGAVVLFQT
jgi:hypothetical protein